LDLESWSGGVENQTSALGSRWAEYQCQAVGYSAQLCGQAIINTSATVLLLYITQFWLLNILKMIDSRGIANVEIPCMLARSPLSVLRRHAAENQNSKLRY
jgi:hypothetical protein